jgi:hypothetical protein
MKLPAHKAGPLLSVIILGMSNFNANNQDISNYMFLLDDLAKPVV